MDQGFAFGFHLDVYIRVSKGCQRKRLRWRVPLLSGCMNTADDIRSHIRAVHSIDHAADNCLVNRSALSRVIFPWPSILISGGDVRRQNGRLIKSSAKFICPMSRFQTVHGGGPLRSIRGEPVAVNSRNITLEECQMIQVR